MSVISMKQLLEAGVHFGHRSRRWNPKMRPYIFTERNGIHIIDLQQTIRGLEKAYNFVRDTVAEGGTVLFVGTKRQAQENVQSQAERCGMPYITDRWLGGTLTNFRTIRSRIEYMLELENLTASGGLDVLPKKEATLKTRELSKLHRRLGADFNSFDPPDFLFPQLAPAHAPQVKMLVPHHDLRLYALHPPGHFVERSIGQPHQHQQQRYGNRHRQDA
ncbi:MAG: 30S ribosomal protein S2 [Planctomycetes bacterium ADurb.Bin412]|nr:MAG: 30S ribosomal protein S2 [Planctomycetes bacterium ADurb.Bin412]